MTDFQKSNLKQLLVRLSGLFSGTETATAIDATTVTASTLQVGGIGITPDIVYIKDADTSRASTTTLADDDDLLVPSSKFEASTWYFILAKLSFTCASTAPGVQWRFSVTGSPHFGIDTLIAGGSTGNTTNRVATTTTRSEAPAAAGLHVIYHVASSFKTDATPANWGIQWAQHTSSISNVTLQEGSWIMAAKGLQA